MTRYTRHHIDVEACAVAAATTTVHMSWNLEKNVTQGLTPFHTSFIFALTERSENQNSDGGHFQPSYQNIL